MTLKSVVLPAPLGPMMPSRSPRRTSRLTARTAVRPPKRLVTDSSVSTVPPRTPPRGDARPALQREAHDEGQHDAADDQVDPRDVAEAGRGEARAKGNGHALGARGEAAPAAGDDLEHLGEGDGGEREVRALEAIGEVADHRAGADGEADPDGEAEPRVLPARAHEGGSIRADAEERRVAERDLTRIAARDVPGRGQRAP